MVDPITVAIISQAAKATFTWLLSDSPEKKAIVCAKCHYRAAQSITKCCKTPMCDICISGSVIKKGIFKKVDYFSCSFCAKQTEINIKTTS